MLGLAVALSGEFGREHREIARNRGFNFFFRPRASQCLGHGIGLPATLEGLNALNQGVRGYTHAYGVPALLQEVALVVEHGGLWVGPDLLQRLVGASNAALAGRAALDKAKARAPAATADAVVAAPVANVWALLSAREAQVARAVTVGRSNREVADLLFISERTVKAHLGAVFEKLGVRDRLQLVLRLAASADPGSTPATELLP